MAQHADNPVFVEEIGAVFHLQPDVISVVLRKEEQVELRVVAGRHQRIDLQPVQADEGELLVAVAPVEHHLE